MNVLFEMTSLAFRSSSGSSDYLLDFGPGSKLKKCKNVLVKMIIEHTKKHVVICLATTNIFNINNILRIMRNTNLV